MAGARSVVTVLALLAVVVAGCGGPTSRQDVAPRVVLEVLVLDAVDGSPVAGADVQATTGATTVSDSTAGDGLVRLPVPPAASCSIVVAHDAYATAGLGVPCLADARHDVRLVPATAPAVPPAGTAAVRTAPGEFPLTGWLRATATQEPIAAAAIRVEGGATTRTASDGSFAFSVPPGRHVLSAGAACWTEASFPVEVTGPTKVTLGLEADEAPPAAPVARVVPGPGPSQLTIAWDEVPDATGYVLHRQGEPALRLGLSLAYTVPDATPNDRFAVTASDDCGQASAASPEASGTPLLWPAPSLEVLAPVPAVDEGDVAVAEATYAAFAPNGTALPPRGWRTVTDTGNCCENYLAVTRDGRILDQGSSPVYVSDDEGRTWQSHIHPLVQFYGEGSVAAAPDGDAVAFDWATYNGDTAFSYRYSALTGAWQTAAVAKPPGFDRPWITVLKGPFERDGKVAPYVVVVQGLTGILLSLDGLHYEPTTMQAAAGSVRLDPLMVASDPERDWIAGAGEVVALSLGPGLAYYDPKDNGLGAFDPPAGLVGTATWTGMDLPAFPGVVQRVDGAGGLHALDYGSDDGEATYSWSHDGGRSWDSATLQVPGAVWQAELQVNRALDQAVVAMHVAKADGNDLYRAYRFTGLDRTPTLHEWLDVGLGDAPQRGNAAGGGQRFDFMTVGFLPTGRIVMSFADSEHPDPAIAIEL